MSARSIACAALAVTLWLGAGPAFAADKPAPLVVQSVATSAYPSVTVRLMVPSSLGAAGAPSFSVRENGVELRDVKASAVAGERTPLAVVLALDTSGSMRGAPLAAAQEAAGSFLASLRPEDEAAVVGFNTRPEVLSPFTSDRAQSLGAVRQLQASGETALYDALIAADTLALSAPGRQRVVVLLSDGGDTQSSSTLQAALTFVKDAAVPVFAVGLESPEAAPSVLAQVADQTRGRTFAAKDTASLAGAYDDVARQIQNQYDVTFQSARPDTKDLEIAVSASGRGAAGAASLVIPNPGVTLPAVATLPRVPDAVARPVVIGVLGIVAVAALVFGAVALLATGLLGALLDRRRPLDQLAYYDQRTSEAEDARPTGLRARLMAAVGAVSTKRGLTAEVQERLEAAGLPLRPVEYITTHLVFVIVFGLVTQLFTGSVLFGLLIILAAAFGPLFLLDVLAQRRRAAFARQLPDILGLIAGSLRAGYGLMQAVEHIVREASAPASVEFQRVQTEARLGLRIEDALEKMAVRMGSDDFAWAVSAINIQREVGGNLAEVLDIVSSTIRERESLRRQVDALTSEGRLSAVILVCLPFVMALVMFVVVPGYVMVLFKTAAGLFMVGFAALLMVVGVLWLRSVAKIEV